MDLSDGHMTTGFKQIDGKWYFFRPNGLMAQSHWINPEYGKWYYFLGDGTMVTGWLKIGNDYYFMRGDGSMGTGWRQMDGAWYYFQSSGKCVVNSWAQIKDNWYLLPAYTHLAIALIHIILIAFAVSEPACKHTPICLEQTER